MSATAGVSRAGARTGLQLLGHGGTQRFNSTNDHEHKDNEKQFQSPGGASTSVSTFGVNTHLDWGKNSAYRWPARRPKVHMLIGTFWARTIQQRGGDEPTQKLAQVSGSVFDCSNQRFVKLLYCKTSTLRASLRKGQ